MLTADDRERILGAMAELVAERGYHDVTMEMVQKRADVSRTVFRRYFESREQCFVACFEHGFATLNQRLDEAVDPESEWPERVCDGLAALLDLAAEQPLFARICLLEPPIVGGAGTEAQRRALAHFVTVLRAGRSYPKNAEKLPACLEESIVGALIGMMRRRLERDEADALPTLLPTMLQFSLTPYLGAERAGELASAGRA